MLTVLTALTGSAAIAMKPAELIEGPEGLSAYQKAGVIWHRVVITYNGDTILSKRLRMLDRGGEWDTEFMGRPVNVRCNTHNGYSLAIDCKLYGAKEIARITIPYVGAGELVSGPEGLTGGRVKHTFREQVIIDYKGERVAAGDLWLRDGVGEWRGRLEGQRVRVRCATVNDFTRIIDCRIYTTGEEAMIAHLRVPLF